MALAGVLAAALVASFGVLAPAALAAPAEGQALQELTGGSPATETTPTTSTSSTTTTSSNSNSRTTILLALGGAVLLLCAIGFVIARDARRVAPATDAELAESRSRHDPAVMLRKRRAKAKAARQARKRNR
jgi:hypothetical protein